MLLIHRYKQQEKMIHLLPARVNAKLKLELHLVDSYAIKLNKMTKIVFCALFAKIDIDIELKEQPKHAHLAKQSWKQVRMYLWI